MTAEELEGQLQGLMYNQGMLRFLEAQIDKVKDIKIPSLADLDSLDRFDDAFSQGQRLIAKHRCPFDLRTFYKIEEARNGIQEICAILREVMVDWGKQQEVQVLDVIPDAVVEEDRRVLYVHLGYVLEGKRCTDRSFQKEWGAIKKFFDNKMQQLQIVDPADIAWGRKLGKGGGGNVYRGYWKNSPIAIKSLNEDGTKLSLEDFKDFFNEVRIQASLNHPRIVRLHAAAKTGLILMELADNNLSSVCQNEVLEWPTKLKLLQDAAAGLEYMHSKRLIHCDVKSPNYLIFKTSLGRSVKIADFGLTIEVSETRSRTIRKGGGTWEWMAPEIHKNEPHTKASDVFSFGVVMYEVVTGCHPYQRGASNAVIMNKKLTDKPPCNVKEGDCPQEMLKLMKDCCKMNPTERLDMETVIERLALLPLHVAGPLENGVSNQSS